VHVQRARLVDLEARQLSRQPRPQRVDLSHDVVVLLLGVLVRLELDLDARHARADTAADTPHVVQPMERVFDLPHNEPLEIAGARVTGPGQPAAPVLGVTGPSPHAGRAGPARAPRSPPALPGPSRPALPGCRPRCRRHPPAPPRGGDDEPAVAGLDGVRTVITD